jgi:porin
VRALLALTGGLTGFGAIHGAESQTSLDGQEVIAAEVRERETGWEGDHMTGNWSGWRDRLVEEGVHFQAGYAGEVLANVSGGLRRGAIYEGLLELGLTLDTEKRRWWKGGTLHTSALFPHGPGFSGKYVGDVLTVSNIEAYESFRLYQLWFEQKIGEKFSLRMGQLLADDEFAFTEPGSYFMNSAFGWPAFISANTINTGPAFFVAAPGIRLRYEINDAFFAQAGVFDGDTFDSREGDPRVNASGTRIHLSDEQGLFAMAETGWRLNQGEGSTGLPGEYKLGAWAHTGDFDSNFEDAAGDPFVTSGREPKEHSGNFGIYVAAQQMLWREQPESAEGLYAFLRAGASPRDRSFFEFVVDGGFTCQGLIPTRNEDVFGMGAVYARVSRDVRRSERLDAAANGTSYRGFSDHETVLEAFYSVQITKWWTVQPDVQWIFDPGATGGRDGLVLGLRTSFVF